jgi:hypothetical protein
MLYIPNAKAINSNTKIFSFIGRSSSGGGSGEPGGPAYKLILKNITITNESELFLKIFIVL